MQNPFKARSRDSRAYRTAEPREAAGQNHRDPYSAQFDIIKREGHRRPPPVFGAPTLVWHLGVWPAFAADPQQAKINVSFDDRRQSPSAVEVFEAARADQRDRQKRFFDLMNGVVTGLQERGRASSHRESLEWASARDGAGALDEQSVGFTLWWGDNGPIEGTDPGPDALRIRVHVEVNVDFFTCSFYIDAGKPWGGESVYGAGDPGFFGERRARIFSALGKARQIAESRLVSSAVDDDLLPEAGVTAQQSRELLAAAEFAYEGLWEEFQSDFGVNKAFVSTAAGEIFADFRGLVVATAESAPTPQAAAARGFEPYARYDNAANGAPNEANAVLKAWWPFLRRVSSYADYREFVASTVMNRRAIYVTALGAADEFDPRDEAGSLDRDVPALNIPQRGPSRAPIRYMFLSKGEPNRRQIGRMVERINNLGTLRLFALKDIAALREAGRIIRMRGQHLDEVTNAWSVARRSILKEAETARGKTARERRLLEKKRNEALTQLTDEVEGHLIDINAHLDSMGEGAAGALPFIIARSQKYVQQFDELVALLQPETIETWVSYDQFVQRGLRPTFDFIAAVGVRLKALRDRLQATMEAVQTSAVSIQTAATRHNTDTLSDIAVNWRQTSSMIALFTTVVTLLNWPDDALAKLLSVWRWMVGG